MKLRGVIGKLIAGVRQKVVRSNHRLHFNIEAIILGDGTEIRPTVHGTNDAPIVDAVVIKPKKEGTT